MNPRYLRTVLTGIAALPFVSSAHAANIGTAFTYQGSLESGAPPGPVDDTCNFRFSLWKDATSTDPPDQAGPTLTFDGAPNPPPIDVNAGVFSVALDFGDGSIESTARWLEIEVCCPSPCAPVLLDPRVELTPAPYALWAAQGVGPPGVLEVTPTGELNLTKDLGAGMANHLLFDANNWTMTASSETGTAPIKIKSLSSNGNSTWMVVDDASSSVTIAGEAAGANTAGLTPPPKLRVTLEAAAATAGGAGAGVRFEAYDDKSTFPLRLSGNVGIGIDEPSERLEVGGNIHASGTITTGSTITIDGTSGSENISSSASLDLRTAAGRALRLENNATSPNLIGGYSGNTAIGPGGTIGGGGESGLVNSVTGVYGTVSGGRNNTASAYGTVGGGASNAASGLKGTVGGGLGNTASAEEATVGGGRFNEAGHLWSTIAGGINNTSTNDFSAIGGGSGNSAGDRAFVGGGQGNTASGTTSTVGGGNGNLAGNSNSSVGGGQLNNASGFAATVPGGQNNLAGGLNSFAAGERAKVRNGDILSPFYAGDANGDEGTFVWADSIGTDFTSTGPNQFLIRATGGVGIGTNGVSAQLDVEKSGATVAAFNRTTNDGTVITIQQGGITEGTISVSGTTVSYNAFTGSHYAWTDETISRGTLVTMTGVNRASHDNPESERIYGVAATTKANDPKCLGAYLGLLEPTKPATLENPHQVMAVGNGDMWVVDSGRNIEPGQYLISSDLRGHAMLDDAERFAVGHVVARAGEPADWSTVIESVDGRKHKKISVFFESFERGSAVGLGKIVEQQQLQIEELSRRLCELEVGKPMQSSAATVGIVCLGLGAMTFGGRALRRRRVRKCPMSIHSKSRWSLDPDAPEIGNRHSTIRQGLVSIFCVSAFCVSAAFAQSGGGYNIKKSTIDSGGHSNLTGGGYKLGGTVGQHDASALTGGDYVLTGGFWSPNAVEPPPTITWDADSISADRTTRSLRFTVSPPATATGSPGQSAIKVTMIDLQNPQPPNLPQNPPPNFSTFESATCTAAGEMIGCARWVGKPGTFYESQDDHSLGSYRAARLQCSPFYHDWVTETASGPITVVGAEIVPSSQYSVQSYAASCKGQETGCSNVSVIIPMQSRRFGDVASAFVPPDPSGQPNAIDIAQLVNHFKRVTGALRKAVVQLQPNLVELNADVNALDIVETVDSVKELAYRFSGPCACPSAVPCPPAMGSVACASPAVCVTAFGAGAICVKTCTGGDNAGEPCINDSHCPGPGGTCPSGGFCRDRCGRCN